MDVGDLTIEPIGNKLHTSLVASHLVVSVLLLDFEVQRILFILKMYAANAIMMPFLLKSCIHSDLK